MYLFPALEAIHSVDLDVQRPELSLMVLQQQALQNPHLRLVRCDDCD